VQPADLDLDRPTRHWLRRSGRQRTGRRHRGLQPSYGGHRRGRPVERPVQPAEGDHPDADRDLREDHQTVERQPAVDRRRTQRPEHQAVGHHNDQQAPDHRAFPQARRGVLQLEEPSAPLREPTYRPVGEAEQPQLLGRLGLDRQLVRVVGVALRRADLGRVAVLPDTALAQQPMRRGPRGDEHQRRPPTEAEQHHRGSEPADQLDQAARDEVDVQVHRRSGLPAVELARDGQVLAQLRILEVPDPRRPDAGLRERIVQVRRHAAAEVGADRLMHRRQHLQQDERRTHQAQRRGQRGPVLHRADQPPHRDREDRGQRAPRQQERPPDRGQPPIGPWQHGEELPLRALTQSAHHLLTMTPPTDRSLERLPDGYGRTSSAADLRIGACSRLPPRRVPLRGIVG
jgi:hypothetical protein